MKLRCAFLFVFLSSLAALAQAQGHGRVQHERGQRHAERGQQRAEAERVPHQALREEREPKQQMSPEERKQLRRDVDDAGRELYRRPPEGRR